MALKVCVFDAYGTLFDVNSAARNCAAEPGREEFSKLWPLISAHWREKQLSYTWLLNILGEYSDFWQVTENALDFALESVGLNSDKDLKKRLLNLYKELDTYSEVRSVLSNLNEREIACVILSNGSKLMLNSAVINSGVQPYVNAVMSVDEVGVFKPDSRVYQMVLNKMHFKIDEVLFISSNGWDIAGASSFGFKTLWINRLNQPFDRLPFKPDFIGFDLNHIQKLVK